LGLRSLSLSLMKAQAQQASLWKDQGFFAIVAEMHRG
jgi:hypothetical protein